MIDIDKMLADLEASAEKCAEELIRVNHSVFIFCLLQGYIDDNGNLNGELRMDSDFDNILIAYQDVLREDGSYSEDLANEWFELCDKYDDGWSGNAYSFWMGKVQDHLIDYFLVQMPRIARGRDVAWSDLQLKARHVRDVRLKLMFQ